MTRLEATRSEIQRLVRASPFQPFVLSLENGDHIVIEHPENIAFHPGGVNGTGGSTHFYVLSKQLSLYSTFGSVSAVALLDRGEPTP